jgi:hypothetical protein
MKSTLRVAVRGVAMAALLAVAAPSYAQLNQAVSEAERATAAAAASQARIDRVADEAGDAFRDYRAALQTIERRELFVEQQRVFLQSQQNELTDLESQIGNVDEVLQGLTPMMFTMIDELESFIELDIPFLMDDRRERIVRLRELMDESPSDVPPAEKYRKIIEAYQIETDYGRFVAGFEGRFSDDPHASTDPDAPVVDYLRVGRVSLIYMFKDGSRMGIYNPEAKQWDDLPGSYRLDIQKALRIAREVTTPDVFTVPMRGARSAS